MSQWKGGDGQLPNDGYNKRLAVNTEPNRNARVCNSDFRRVYTRAHWSKTQGKKGRRNRWNKRAAIVCWAVQVYACVCELPVDTPSTFSFSPSLFLSSRYTSELRDNRDDNRQGNWTMEIMSKVRVQTGKGGRRTTRGRIAFPLLFFCRWVSRRRLPSFVFGLQCLSLLRLGLLWPTCLVAIWFKDWAWIRWSARPFFRWNVFVSHYIRRVGNSAIRKGPNSHRVEISFPSSSTHSSLRYVR